MLVESAPDVIQVSSASHRVSRSSLQSSFSKLSARQAVAPNRRTRDARRSPLFALPGAHLSNDPW